jgi:hypothetical protein
MLLTLHHIVMIRATSYRYVGENCEEAQELQVTAETNTLVELQVALATSSSTSLVATNRLAPIPSP